MPMDSLRQASSSAQLIDECRREMEYLAYHGRHAIVYKRYKSMSAQERGLCQSTNIFYSIVRWGIEHVSTLKALGHPTAATKMEGLISDVDQDLDQFIQYCEKRGISSRELFECILDWMSVRPIRASADTMLWLLTRAESLQIRNYPRLYARLVLAKGELLFGAGRLQEAHQLLSVMARRHYLIPDRDVFFGIIALHGKTSLLTGEARYYKDILISGLRSRFMPKDIRRFFTSLIMNKLYRYAYQVLLDTELSMYEKMLFTAQLLDRAVHRRWLGRVMRLDVLTGLVPLVTVSVLGRIAGRDRSHRHDVLNSAKQGRAQTDQQKVSRNAGARNKILVTRAIGGIGDLLMMTPGLHALKKKFPSSEIHLAISRKFAPLFLDNSDVTLLDIEVDNIDTGSYAKWVNFTDCPEATVETRTAPNVKKSRIDIFSRSLGIRGRRLRTMDKRPCYYFTREERDFQKQFWHSHSLEGKAVIGVQLQAAESYRDYPHMSQVVRRLSEEYSVLLFHSEKTGVQSDGAVFDTGSIPLRQSFALAAACSVIVAPDSAFVHFSAAFDIPCVALYGPIDGRVRTMHYPSCRLIDVRHILQCVPCWRHEAIPCKLTNMRSSACMGNIAVDTVVEAVKQVLKERS